MTHASGCHTSTRPLSVRAGLGAMALLMVTTFSSVSTATASPPVVAAPAGDELSVGDNGVAAGYERLEAVPLDGAGFDPSGSNHQEVPLDTTTGDAQFQQAVSDLADDATGDVVAAAGNVALVDIPTDEQAAARREFAAQGIELRQPVPVDVRPTDEPTADQIGGVSSPQPESPQYGPLQPSVVSLTRADKWQTAGFNGTGIKIGVIDYFDTKYWNTNEHGPLPIAGVNAKCLDIGRDCTSEIFDGADSGGEKHGVAVVEILRDMAPGAQIYLGEAYSVVDYNSLVDWFNSNGVTIISRSLGARYDSAGDGSGPLADVAAHATQLGMVWVNAAGNSGGGRYYRQPVRYLGNDVAFGPAGDTTRLPFKNCVSLAGIRWANDWNLPAAQKTDLDAYLWEAPTGNPGAGRVVASSERTQRTGATPLEGFANKTCPSSGNTLYLQVTWKAGPRDGDTLEVLDYQDGIAQFTQPDYSAATSVVSSNERSVLSVGAIDPPSGTAIGSYSSRGPSNNGRILPSLSAPSGFSNSVYGTFSGTSASAPVVAGAVALVKQAGAATYNDSVADFIRNSVIDLGAPGPDNTFGTGELNLPDPPKPAVSQAPAFYTALTEPTRLLDTRPPTAVGPANLIGRPWIGKILRLPILGSAGIPANATAVAVNVVTDVPDRAGYVQAYPTTYGTLAAYSNVNTDGPGQARANMAIIPIGADGSISLYAAVGGDLVVDALGYFVPAPTAVPPVTTVPATTSPTTTTPVTIPTGPTTTTTTVTTTTTSSTTTTTTTTTPTTTTTLPAVAPGPAPLNAGRFEPIATPQRVLDTRITRTPIRTGSTIDVPMPTGIDPAQVSALVVTVTGIQSTHAAWIQAYPRGRPSSKGKTSTVNLEPKVDMANLAIVPTDGGGISLTADVANGGTADVAVDVIGYITSSSAPANTKGLFVPVVPNRALDTRLNGGKLTNTTLRTVRGSDAPGVNVPATATGIVWNATATESAQSGFAVVWAPNASKPQTSNFNWWPNNRTQAGAVISGAANGSSNFQYVNNQVGPTTPIAQLIVDVFGYFT